MLNDVTNLLIIKIILLPQWNPYSLTMVSCHSLNFPLAEGCSSDRIDQKIYKDIEILLVYNDS